MLRRKGLIRQSALAQTAELLWKIVKKATLAKADNQCGAIDSAAIAVARLHESRKCRQQGERDVIYAEIAEVFKCVRRRCHARAAQAGDDYDVRGRARAFTVCFTFHSRRCDPM